MPARSNGSLTVGYVVSAWPRLSETFILNEVIAVERLGIPVSIFSIKSPKDEPIHAQVGQVRARVTYLSIKQSRNVMWRANARLFCRRPIRYCRTLLRAVRYGSRVILRRFLQAGYLAELLRGERVVHLHAHFASDPALVAMLVHQLTGIPYTFTAHAKDIYVKTPPELLRIEARQAQAVVTCTEYNRRYLASRIDATSDHKLQCIYHGVDLSQFPFRWPRPSDPGPPVIFSVARLVEKKGLSDLVLAADTLRRRGCRFRVEIAGDGPLRQALEAQVSQLGLNDWVTLLGALPHESICRAYQQASIFALPCIIAVDGDRDGIPNVLLEAMASGLPVVSTPVSGIPELIESERDGLLVPAHSPAMLADAIDRLLTQPELGERLARAARAKIEERFSVDRNSARLVTLFRKETTDENSVPVY
jgi:glycosyltransferase involved in cell wall biosynthesis